MDDAAPNGVNGNSTTTAQQPPSGANTMSGATTPRTEPVVSSGDTVPDHDMHMGGLSAQHNGMTATHETLSTGYQKWLTPYRQHAIPACTVRARSSRDPARCHADSGQPQSPAHPGHSEAGDVEHRRYIAVFAEVRSGWRPKRRQELDHRGHLQYYAAPKPRYLY